MLSHESEMHSMLVFGSPNEQFFIVNIHFAMMNL